MSANSEDDYPPHWNPPPRLGYREQTPSLEGIRDAMSADWPADWVAAIYLAKIERALMIDILPHWHHTSWAELAEVMQEYGDEFRPIDPEHRKTAAFLHEHLPSLDEADRAALKQIAQPPTP